MKVVQAVMELIIMDNQLINPVAAEMIFKEEIKTMSIIQVVHTDINLANIINIHLNPVEADILVINNMTTEI